MTTVTLVFLTLFTWMVSSGTWLRLDRCTELSQCGRDEETKGCSSTASHTNTVIHDQTQLTCDRSPEMSVASERISTQDRVKKDCFPFPGVTVNCTFCNGSMKLLQTVHVSRHVCRCKVQQLLVYFMSKTSCLLLSIEIQADNYSTHLNYRSIRLGLDCICICKAFKLEVKTLQGFLHKELGLVYSEFLISVLSESQASLMTSEESKKVHIRICCVQMPLHFCTPHCPREEFLTQADGIKCIVYMSKVETVRPLDTNTWAARYFLAAVLLLGIYMTRIKIPPSGLSAAHGSNTTMMFFTMTLRSFSPSVSVPQPSEWSQVAVGISFVVCLSCALRRTMQVLTAHRAAHAAVKLFRPTQQQLRTLPVTMLFIWLTFSPPFSNKSMKLWFEDILEGSVGSAVRSWAVMGQIEILATLCCVIVSLSRLIQSILIKWNFLSVLLHVTCLQNSRVPRKYVVVIKIHRLI